MAAAGAPFSGIALFARLPEAALDELARNSQTRNYPAGQVLWTEGDPGNSLIVLESGQLRVTRFADTGQDVVLAVLDAPAALGEMSLIDGEPRSATVIARSPCDLLVLDDFLTTPVTPQTAAELLNILAAREGRGSTLVTSQFDPPDWYKSLQDAVIAESILNRIVGAAEIIALDGPNMRRHLATTT